MMEGTYYKEWSAVLDREMEFKVYGHGGVPVLALPARGGRFYDWENNGMPDAAARLLHEGKIQLFCADSIDGESLLAGNETPRRRAEMQEKYFVYLTSELAARIAELNAPESKEKPLIWCVGVDTGAYQAVQCRLRRPRTFAGAMGLSGLYDMNRFLGSGSVCQAKYNALFECGAQIEPYQPAGSVTCQLIDRLFEAMEKEPEGYEFVTIGLMWQLFGQILLQHSYTVSSPGNKRNDRITAQMKAALERIRKNYASRITLEDLASTAEMTPEHFCRVFHSITGRSPIDYLNYYRVECAAELLCSTEDPITEIAYSCGFSDSSYFNRMFRRYKAEAPGKYRKLHSI